MLQNELTITLDDPIVYKVSDKTSQQLGVTKESNILICKSPSVDYKYRKHTAYLKQQFMRGMIGMQKSYSDAVSDIKKENTADDNSLSGDVVLGILYMIDIDICEYEDRFKKMICGVGISELITINGEIPLTITHYENMSEDNRDQFMSEYIAFFLLNSLMKKLAKS